MYSEGYGSDATYEDELDERTCNMGFTRGEVGTMYGVRHIVYSGMRGGKAVGGLACGGGGLRPACERCLVYDVRHMVYERSLRRRWAMFGFWSGSGWLRFGWGEQCAP